MLRATVGFASIPVRRMHERVKFANEILAKLSAAGVKPLPTYDAGSNMLVLRQSYDGRVVHLLLARFFEHYRMAMHPRTKEQVLHDFVRLWRSGSLETTDLQPHRWLPLLRSRWHFEAGKFRWGGASMSPELQQAGLFAYQLITNDLALAVAEDLGETYRFLSPFDLKQTGLTFEQALQRAIANLPSANGPGLSGPSFEEMRGLAWLPTGDLNEHVATRLLDVEAIQKLPVRGQYVAFVPHTHVLWITGTYQHKEVGLLVELAMQECANPPGKPLVSGPLILDDKGHWQPWHPEPTHPNYWNVKRLHTLGEEQLYGLQKELLDQQATGPNPPFVASYRALEGGREGSGRFFSYCVFATTSLLPRTDYVMLLQITNEAELAANPSADPKFGDSLVLTWEIFAAFQGEHLRPQGMYPERYCIDQFPDDQEWKKLQIEQQKVAPEFLEVVLNPAFQNDCGTLRQQSPASRTAPPLPQPGNWTLAIMVGIIALPVVLVTTLFVLFYLAVWVPVRAAQNVPRQGPLFPQVVQPQLGLPQEAQVFAEDEWQPMEEPFSLPMVEGAVPAVDAQTPASERVELVSPDARGSQQFMDRSVTGEPLVGLRIIQGDNWGGAVQALQPIYLGKDCYFLGTWCGAPGGKQQAQSIAKPSYAVGAVELRRGLVVNAIRIEYWRIADGKLDPADKYVTDWYGCKGGSKLPPMSSEGRSVIGIAGKFHEDLYELQIICSNEK